MNNTYKHLGIRPADILLPFKADMHKWSVVACDQYTSEPAYWQEVERIVGDAPSTYHMILPELYLQDNPERRIADVNAAMRKYLDDSIFDTFVHSFIYVERTLENGKLRRGIVVAVDLECYQWQPGNKALIRATEGTVPERIPPRVRVRCDAPLETPHIMLLIDDPDRTVIEPYSQMKDKMKKAYDFTLMQHGGAIAGWAVEKQLQTSALQALKKIAEPDVYAQRYGLPEAGVMLYAMGDGNHSLATAKECWERIKQTLTLEEQETHPARFALAEIVNLHDDSLIFEPIHRLVTGCNSEEIKKVIDKLSYNGADSIPVHCIVEGKEIDIRVKARYSPEAVNAVQQVLDAYSIESGANIDYIHGDDTLIKLASQKGCAGFMLPVIGKDELFGAVLAGGALPRKTFSMGEANEKRFYLECRKIK